MRQIITKSSKALICWRNSVLSPFYRLTCSIFTVTPSFFKESKYYSHSFCLNEKARLRPKSCPQSKLLRGGEDQRVRVLKLLDVHWRQRADYLHKGGEVLFNETLGWNPIYLKEHFMGFPGGTSGKEK